MRKMTEEELEFYKKTREESETNIRNMCLDFATLCVLKIGEVYADSLLVQKTVNILKELKE